MPNQSLNSSTPNPGRIVLKAQKIFREWLLTFALPASILRSGNERRETGDELVVVQSIIYLLAVTKDGLILVDFKTDHISASKIAERTENYREQLDLYGRATQAILKKKLVGKWLYFLKPELAWFLCGSVTQPSVEQR